MFIHPNKLLYKFNKLKKFHIIPLSIWIGVIFKVLVNKKTSHYDKLKGLEQISKQEDINAHFSRWRGKDLTSCYRNGYLSNISDLNLDNLTVIKIRSMIEKKEEIILADIDQDGFFLSRIGKIPGLPCIKKKDFQKRKRLQVQLVIYKGLPGIKKHFKENILGFFKELTALYHLGKLGCNVPALLNANLNNKSIICSFIPGLIVREALAKHGALLRDRDVDSKNNMFSQTEKNQMWLYRIKQGLAYIEDALSKEFCHQVVKEINKIHLGGFVLNDIKYGNIIIEKKTKKPFFIDFEYADYFPGVKKSAMRLLSENDDYLIRLHFFGDQKSLSKAQQRINKGLAPEKNDWYHLVKSLLYR
jgi:tRNA A-37 threonylcarbamoyl transferase component Bud32